MELGTHYYYEKTIRLPAISRMVLRWRGLPRRWAAEVMELRL
jgi:hypothetical protein